MSIISAFGGRFSALDYAYGANVTVAGPALQIGTGNASTGAGTITLITGQTQTQGGQGSSPVSTNTPILVGFGSNAETVTPTGVSVASLTGAQPGTGSITITATFANIHGPQESVVSGTYGLQEAINRANAVGGGIVVITPSWYAAGGTVTMVQAASLPTNFSVTIEDIAGDGAAWAPAASSTTALAVPATATSAVVASQAGVVGTWTATTIHVVFAYVTANGGITLTSADYSFTSTVSLAIGGSGPIAATGAVGYLVFMGTTAWKVPVTASNGTVITCGSVLAFKIGTPFSVATATTSALAVVPVQSTAFQGVQPMPFENPAQAQEFATVSGPFAVTGVVTAGTAKEWGGVQLPAAFLNYVGRTLLIKAYGYYTPVSTATLILSMNLVSVYGVTTTTLFTVTTPASSGTAAANIDLEIIMETVSTGTAGTIECHGRVLYGGATGTAGLFVAAGDSVQVPSAAANLTTQDFLQLTINSGTANLTTSQLRILTIELLS